MSARFLIVRSGGQRGNNDMARKECRYTIGEVKALIGPLAELTAEDVTGYAVVITSKTQQRMLVLSNGETAANRIQLLANAIMHEAMEASQEGQLWASATCAR